MDEKILPLAILLLATLLFVTASLIRLGMWM